MQNLRSKWKELCGLSVFLCGSGGLFYLGHWQWQRKKWKEELLAERQILLEDHSESISVQQLREQMSTSDNDCRYRLVNVVGELDYDKQFYVGPRPPPDDSYKRTDSLGYFVVTPCYTEPHGFPVLVNRGWVPACLIGNTPYYEERVHEVGTPLKNAVPQARVSLKGVSVPGHHRSSFVKKYVLFYDSEEMSAKQLAGVRPPKKSNQKNSADIGDKPKWPFLDLECFASITQIPKPHILVDVTYPVWLGDDVEHGRLTPEDVDGIQHAASRWPARHETHHFMETPITPFKHGVYAATWYTLGTSFLLLTVKFFSKRFS